MKIEDLKETQTESMSIYPKIKLKIKTKIPSRLGVQRQ